MDIIIQIVSVVWEYIKRGIKALGDYYRQLNIEAIDRENIRRKEEKKNQRLQYYSDIAHILAISINNTAGATKLQEVYDPYNLYYSVDPIIEYREGLYLLQYRAIIKNSPTMSNTKMTKLLQNEINQVTAFHGTPQLLLKLEQSSFSEVNIKIAFKEDYILYKNQLNVRQRAAAEAQRKQQPTAH